MSVTTIRESLKCILTQKELAEGGQSAGLLQQKLSAEQETLKEVTTQIKARIAACEAELKAMGNRLANGYEFRQIECKVYFHDPEKGHKRVVRTDDWQTIRIEKMDAREMQQNLFEEEQPQTVSTPEPPPPAAEPVVENSADPTGAPPVVEEPVENQDQPEPELENVDHVELPEPPAEDPVVPEEYEAEPEQPAPTGRRRRSRE